MASWLTARLLGSPPGFLDHRSASWITARLLGSPPGFLDHRVERRRAGRSGDLRPVGELSGPLAVESDPGRTQSGRVPAADIALRAVSDHPAGLRKRDPGRGRRDLEYLPIGFADAGALGDRPA